MNAQNYWQLFLDTGAPEMYLLYNKARKAEGIHVFNDSGVGTSGNSLQ